jgi:DNA-binding NtrC family response regulator
MDLLVRHDWPGNVRELRNEIQRAAALSDKVIVPLVLSSTVRRTVEEPEEHVALGEKPMKDIVKEVTGDLERRLIREALRRTHGRKAGAARLLGISRPTLDSKIEAYGVEVTKR